MGIWTAAQIDAEKSMAKMNRERVYNDTMIAASHAYRRATINGFEAYMVAIEAAGRRYKVAEGDVLLAQDACRDEIEDAGVAYDDAVFVALRLYIATQDDALNVYLNT